eukprot:TRINITY_DN691_c0_g4_i1.p2 TRINITY_DN691_c0_g4~~TRINITY_DN691_c0_g4_i1.p2  ORF type:complete len:106 (+),score=5.10 TRINITY_DN691_c0_g4_i1:274-591(+)
MAQERHFKEENSPALRGKHQLTEEFLDDPQRICHDQHKVPSLLEGREDGGTNPEVQDYFGGPSTAAANNGIPIKSWLTFFAGEKSFWALPCLPLNPSFFATDRVT